MTARFVAGAALLGFAATVAPAEPAPMEAYLVALHAAIMRAWVQPSPARPDFHCPVDIVQSDGGHVVQASFGNDCNADAATRAALERAVRNASPLPYAGFESVFQRRVRLVFKPSGH
jgi:colicin import membrane protein